MGKTDKTPVPPAKPAAPPEPTESDWVRIPESLARTRVCRRVPVAVRTRLDKAILLRDGRGATLDAVAREFGLGERYGITPAALRSYARKLEQVIRPVAASQLIAAALGCLPDSYRRQLASGSQVLLLSKIVQALTTDPKTALPVADLVRLGTVLSAVGGKTSPARSPSSGSAHGQRTKTRSSDAEAGGHSTEPAKIAEAVHLLYGLPWPPQESDHGPTSTSKPE